MPLKISLKPGERMIVGGAVIRCLDSPAHILVENKVPILREKDILAVEAVHDDADRLYFTLQLMYVDDANLAEHYKIYWPLAHRVAQTVQGAERILEQVNRALFDREFYKALKLARRLRACP